MRQWISQPHWQEWWGDVDEEIVYIIDMLEGRDTTKPFIFSHDGKAIGYLQYWFPKDCSEADRLVAPWINSLPVEAVGVDISIGPKDLLGRGIGSQILSQFASYLQELGHTNIIIDPDPANQQAIAAYKKAGFTPIEPQPLEAKDVLLMQYSY